MRSYMKWMPFAAAAVLAIQLPSTVWAGTWSEQGDGWYYQQDGSNVTGTWVKGQTGKLYYLGDNGRMVVNAFVQGDGDNRYYVDESGARVTGWYQPDGVDNGDDWYYFNANGAAITGKKVIDGKKYFFDPDGKMLTGWVSWSDNEAQPFTESLSDKDGDVYYCLKTGEAASGWLSLTTPDIQDDSADQEPFWYNFDGGKVRTNTKDGIDGKDYIFGTDGRMITGWAYKDGDTWQRVDENTDSSDIDRFKTDVTQFYYAGEDGAVVKNNWVKAKVYDGLTGDGDEDTAWYFFNKQGRMVGRSAAALASPSDAMNATSIHGSEIYARVHKGNKGKYDVKSGDDSDVFNEDAPPVTIKKVNNKYYMFDTKGKLADGLLYLPKTVGRFQQGYYDYDDNSALKTGAVVMTDDGNTYYYYFSKGKNDGFSLGQGVTGIVDGRLYVDGLAVMAESGTGWEPAYIEPRQGRSISGLFLVDETGKVKYGGTVINQDGTQYKLERKGDLDPRHSGFQISFRDGTMGYQGNDGYQEISPDDTDTVLPLRPDAAFHKSDTTGRYYPTGVSEYD